MNDYIFTEINKLTCMSLNSCTGFDKLPSTTHGIVSAKGHVFTRFQILLLLILRKSETYCFLCTENGVGY